MKDIEPQVLHPEEKVEHPSSRGLRKLADLLDKMEAAKIPIGAPHEIQFLSPQEDLATCVSVFRLLGTCRKNFTDYTFNLEKDFGGVKAKFVWHRKTICERKVVGKKQVEAYTVPAHEEEIVEWVCPGPLSAVQAAPPVQLPEPAEALDEVSF